MKYRLIEERANGGHPMYWIEERVFLFGWGYVANTCTYDLSDAEQRFKALQDGKPLVMKRVLKTA